MIDQDRILSLETLLLSHGALKDSVARIEAQAPLDEIDTLSEPYKIAIAEIEKVMQNILRIDA